MVAPRGEAPRDAGECRCRCFCVVIIEKRHQGGNDASSSSASSAAAQRLSATLKEYERWLIAGLHTFKRQGGAVGGSSGDSSSSSRAALLAGAPLSLNIGAKKIAVDGRLVQAALELAVVAVSSMFVVFC